MHEQLFVLADTSYNAEAVDEIAAAHVHAHALVHYGRASLSAVAQLPALFVFGRERLHAPGVAAALAGRLAGDGQEAGSEGGGGGGQAGVACRRTLLLLPDQQYSHCADELERALRAEQVRIRFLLSLLLPLFVIAGTQARCWQAAASRKKMKTAPFSWHRLCAHVPLLPAYFRR